MKVPIIFLFMDLAGSFMCKPILQNSLIISAFRLFMVKILGEVTSLKVMRHR